MLISQLFQELLPPNCGTSGAPLEEQSSGLSSLGTSDIITVRMIDKYTHQIWTVLTHLESYLLCVYYANYVICFFTKFSKVSSSNAWKVSKYGVISGLLYFPVFGLNTGKCGPEITPCLGTFHAVMHFFNSSIVEEYILHFLGFWSTFCFF